jgi:hypothetical protein
VIPIPVSCCTWLHVIAWFQCAAANGNRQTLVIESLHAVAFGYCFQTANNTGSSWGQAGDASYTQDTHEPHVTHNAAGVSLFAGVDKQW